MSTGNDLVLKVFAVGVASVAYSGALVNLVIELNRGNTSRVQKEELARSAMLLKKGLQDCGLTIDIPGDFNDGNAIIQFLESNELERRIEALLFERHGDRLKSLWKITYLLGISCAPGGREMFGRHIVELANRIHMPQTVLDACLNAKTQGETLHKLMAWINTGCVSVFISYAAEDANVAHKIGEYLGTHGVYCWLYEENSIPGEAHLEQTGRAIDECTIAIVVISEHSIQSEFVTTEVFRASERKKAMLPVLVGMSYEELTAKHPKWLAPLGFSVGITWSDTTAVLSRIHAGVRNVRSS